MTAEKLNIQPTDRSMSRMTTHEHHAQREHPDERVAGGQVEQGVGVDEGRLDRPDQADEQTEGDDDTELFGKAATADGRRTAAAAGRWPCPPATNGPAQPRQPTRSPPARLAAPSPCPLPPSARRAVTRSTPARRERRTGIDSRSSSHPSPDVSNERGRAAVRSWRSAPGCLPPRPTGTQPRGTRPLSRPPGPGRGSRRGRR